MKFMSFCNSDIDCLTKLGKSLKKAKRAMGEQFCVFAFDCIQHKALEPKPSEIDKEYLPLSNDHPHNWDAAFYSATAPAHTEKAILESYDQWISDYESFYGKPSTLYIYSFLIPCLRDGDHGHCSDGIVEAIKSSHERYGLSKVCIGWSNEDRDRDTAIAITHMLADLQEEIGISICIYPRISIADAFVNNLIEDTEDPFKEVIAKLDDIASKVGTFIQPIKELDHAVNQANTIVGDVERLFTAVDGVAIAIVDTRNICLALTPIPVVGEIADEAAAILSRVNQFAEEQKNILTPIKKDVDKVGSILSKVKNGLNELLKVIQEISTDVPSFANTVLILDCLLEIAQPLAEVLKGNEAADRLNKVIEEYNKIKEDVAREIEPVINAVDDITSIISDFVKTIENAVATVGDTIGSALKSLESVDEILSPIKTTISKIEDAIAPVKWALDAASCIFDKVFKPVIDEVLKITGLQSLVDSLENEIEKALGIDKVINALKSAFNLEKITQYGSLFDLTSNSSATSIITIGWNCLRTTLGAYSQHNNQGTKDLVIGLINTITDTHIDPNKPSVIPDWPKPPHYNIPNNSETFFVASKINSSLAISALNRISKVSVAKTAMISNQVLLLLEESQPITTTEDWQGVNELKTAIEKESSQLQTMIGDAELLQKNLEAFQDSLQIPVTFATQLADLEDILKTSSDLFSFIAELNIFKSTFEPVTNVLNNQLDDSKKINAVIPQLKTAVESTSKSVEPVIQHTPSHQIIDDAMKKITGWSNGIDSLVRLVETGIGSSKNPDEKKKVAAKQQEVNERSVAVITTVTNITNKATDISKNIQEINNLLVKYAEALKLVTQHDDLISQKALPTANKIAQNMKTLDSIFDPLSELLNLTGCSDADKPLKIGSNAALTIIKQSAEKSGNQVADFLVQAIEDIAEQVLPLGQLYTAVTNATKKLNDDVLNALDQRCQELVNQLDELTKLLEAKYECKYTTDKGTFTSPNQFVNSDDVAPALALVKTITLNMGDDEMFARSSRINPVFFSLEDADNPYAQQIANWTTYTNYLAGFDGFVLLADTITEKYLPSSLKKKVDGVFHAVYDAAQAVDTEFINGINTMKGGKPPTYELEPTAIPAWPSDDDKNIFQAGWQIVKPALRIWESEASSTSTLRAVIAGLITAGDECVKVLNDAFSAPQLELIDEFSQGTKPSKIIVTATPSKVELEIEF